MKYIIILLSVFMFAVPSFGAKKHKKYNLKIAAKDSGKYLNSIKNYKELFYDLRPFMTESEHAGFIKYLPKLGVKLNQKLPRFRVKGRKLYIDKNNYIMFNSATSMTINGQVFNVSKKPLDVVLRNMHRRLSKKNTHFNYLIPEAFAGGYLGPLLVAGGAALISTAFTRGMSPASRVAVGLAAGLGGALLYKLFDSKSSSDGCNSSGGFLSDLWGGSSSNLGYDGQCGTLASNQESYRVEQAQRARDGKVPYTPPAGAVRTSASVEEEPHGKSAKAKD